MKKIITLCAFALITILGVQNITAQNQNLIEINTQAFEKTDELRKILKFNNTQRDKIFEAFKVYQRHITSLNNNEETNKKIETIFDKKMKEILNEEQYIRYKNLNQ